MKPILAESAALVTGSARGLGAAIARQLAEAGADVAVHYRRSRAQAEAVAASVREQGRRAVLLEADLDSTAEARRLVGEAAAALGRLHLLIHCVGPFLTTPFTRLTDAEWDSTLNPNLKSAWAAAIAAAGPIRQSGGGVILLIGANSALVRTHSIYGLAKAAVSHLTESLAVELGPEIRVNCVAPGMIEGSEPDAHTRRLVIDRTPLGRLVTLEEVAAICVQFCTPTFAAVTGRTLVVDGGRWLR